eukprot:sb/3469355/
MAVLARNQTHVDIMAPHKPEREDEKKRIEDLGGGEPDIKSFLLDGSEDFVIIACDGLWDVIPSWEAVEMVVDYVKDFGVNADKAAKFLVSQAVEKGSQDNVSVVVVFFEEGPLVTSCNVVRLPLSPNYTTIYPPDCLGRPDKEEDSQIFPVPIPISPEAQAILERLDRSMRGTQDSDVEQEEVGEEDGESGEKQATEEETKVSWCFHTPSTCSYNPVSHPAPSRSASRYRPP